MEKRKNIIYIAGIDTYGVRKEKEQWKKLFREKHGSENIEEVRIEEVQDWTRIMRDMQSMGLFATRRLWCFSGGFTKGKKEEWEKTKKKKWEWVEDILINLCESIGEDHFMIFSGLFFDPSKWVLIPWLIAHADTRSSNTIWDTSVWEKRFRELDQRVIQKVLGAYKEAEVGKEQPSTMISESIGWSLEKLTLLSTTTIDDEMIDMSLNRAYSGKMFDLSDAILASNRSKAQSILERMLDTMTPYEIIPSLIGILRGALYAKHLQSLGKKEREIWSLIPIHPYVLGKTLSAKITPLEIKQFYEKLINMNIAYKSGYGMKNGELWRIFSIDLAIMELQKK